MPKPDPDRTHDTLRNGARVPRIDWGRALVDTGLTLCAAVGVLLLLAAVPACTS
jgi:hypothetical protein